MIASLLKGINADHVSPGGGGSDIDPSVQAGKIPSLSYDGTGNYFVLHHTQADTVDKIDPDGRLTCRGRDRGDDVCRRRHADAAGRIVGSAWSRTAFTSLKMEGGMKRRITSASAIAFLIAGALAGRRAERSSRRPCPWVVRGSRSDRIAGHPITSAEEVRGPSFTPPGSQRSTACPTFCRVAGVTKPAVNFEVWLPLDRLERQVSRGGQRRECRLD